MTNISKAQLTAQFTGTPTSGCAPLLVSYTSSSTGNPISYLWDLGNGTQSILPNPSATYFTPGSYTIKLVVTNAAGLKDSITKTNYITVNPKPIVNFTASDTIGCYPLTTQFTDMSNPVSGTITSWQWDFGDGATSNIPNPSHTYSQGTYSVVLRVINDKGCATTLIKPNYIKAVSGVQSAFTYASTGNTCTVPVTINFTNTSTGTGILSYAWNFGDGNTSTATNPTHTYTNTGNYAVTLVVTNNIGCTNTYTVNNAISIGNNIPSFTAPDTVCVDAAVAFNNTSTPTPSGATWSFGDGTTATTISPTKVYTTAGNYIVKMVANFGACKDSVSKPIVVVNKPTLSFTADKTISCRPPLTVQYNSTVTNAATYQWNFGDGNTSTLPNPNHTYNATGQYTVTLTVTSANGCTTTLTKPNYISITAPSIQILNLPDSGCNPLTITPQYTITAPDGVASYAWNFGDGFTSTATNPSHSYITSGVYTLSLIITTTGGCRDSVSTTVKVGTKPNVLFSASPLITCAFAPVIFNSQSTGNPITYWFWQFGDGNISYLENPTYQYQDTGFMNVTLTVGSNGCYDTLKKFNYIYVKPPIARFSPSFNCAAPLTYTFNDQSILPLTWSWNFGDGTSSSAQSPVHTYATPGYYNVTLLVSNDSCSHSVNRLIHVIDERPNFTADQLVTCRNGTITFTSSNYIRSNFTSMVWSYGDGTTITGDSIATHKYTTSGTFTVMLITTDLNGCIDTVTKNQYITVHGATANFTSAVPGSCLNTAIVFNDLSTTDGQHPITSWVFNYGDGTIQSYTAPPYIHQYAGSGAYNVGLTVTDAYGCVDSIIKPSLVTISKPTASFNTPDTIFCPNSNLVFNNNSLGNNLSYVWSFGDGTFSVATNPTHQYAVDGVYTVKLHVTDQYGCTDSMVKLQYILIQSPLASFTVSDSFSTCPPLFVQFTNTSINAISILWDFGDNSSSTLASPTHFYTQPGTFIAKLTITTTGGCSSTYTKPIEIRGPSGTISYNPVQGCNPLTITFNANATNTNGFVWDFNNGQTITTTTPSIIYTYTQVGKFLPRVILKDNAGCSIPVLGLDSVTVFGVMNSITVNQNLVCDSGTVQFTANATSNDPISTYQWQFGDGGIANTQNPTHYYNTTGNYVVKCIATTNLGCKDTSTLNVPINIIKSPQISLSLPPNACVPTSATFNTNIIYNDTSALSWNWNFGNGTSSTVMNPPSVVYNTPGTYTITNIVTNSSGCKDTSTMPYTVYALPIVKAGNDLRICRATPSQLLATGATTYVWSPSLGLSCTNCPNPLANPDSTSIFYLQGTDGNGCKNKDTIEVKVVQPFVMNQSPNAAFCLGKFTTLQANGAATYSWSPSTGLSSTTGNTVIARPTITTQYTVIGSDTFNCFKDTGLINVVVYPIPTINAGNDVTIIGGNSTTLSTITTGGVTTYNWSPGTTLSCTTCPSTKATPIKTTTYTVEATNAGGCKAEDRVTVFVLCDKDNLYIPNTFSPNKDGMNDVLYPRGSGIYSIRSFKIFDRWGELIFEKNNFNANDQSKGWDGTYKGKLLGPDVYVYMIDVYCDNGTPYSFKGNVTIIQ